MNFDSLSEYKELLVKRNSESNLLIITNFLDSNEFPGIKNPNEISSNSNICKVYSTKVIITNISIIAFPVFLSYICLSIQETIILTFLGQKYNNHFVIEGIGVANLYVKIFSISIVNGLTSGFDTFGSNALGVKNYRLFGLYYHRAFLISGVFAISILTFNYIFSLYIIRLFRLNEEVMIYCQDYIQIAIFQVLTYMMFYLNFRYLNNVNSSYITVVILVITSILHPVWSYLAIFVFELGVRGGSICLVFTQLLTALLSTLYIIKYSPYPDSIFFFCKDSFKKWDEYLNLSIPATFLLCADRWADEFLSIIAIWCSDIDYTVFILVFNVLDICWSVIAGFLNALTILVGNNISQNNIEAIKKIKNIALIYGVAIMLIMSSILILFKREILLIYLDNEEVLNKGSLCLIVLAVNQLFDIYQNIYQAYFRGLGKHLIASIICFSNVFICNLGMAVILGKILGYGVIGIFMAYMLGIFLACVVYTIIERYFDYDNLFHEALRRVRIHSRSVSVSMSIDMNIGDNNKIEN